jgi:hypothetical protein
MKVSIKAEWAIANSLKKFINECLSLYIIILHLLTYLANLEKLLYHPLEIQNPISVILTS